MKAIRRRFRAAMLMGAAASMLAFAAVAMADDKNSNDNDNDGAHGNSAHSSPVLAVVGDISCQPGATEPAGEAGKEACNNPSTPYTSTSLWQSQEATANQIENMKPDAVAILGDLQYQVGQFSDFQQSFDLTYGAFKFLHKPSPGNHEFYDEHGATGVAGYGYFSYYNGFQINADGSIKTTTVADPCPAALAAACNYPGLTAPVPQPTPRADGQAGHFELGVENGALNGTGVGDGWYSYNLGTWHLISLNIECSTQPGGCSTTGPWFAAELEWLKKDLAANHSTCTAAYWHQPLHSAKDSPSPEGIASAAFWQLLYKAGADLVLNGHDHSYARYRPVDAAGNYDPHKGIREFVVGTGGETLDAIVASSTGDAGAQFNASNLEAYTGDYWGVMALTLNPFGYAWDFQSALAGPAALVASNGPTVPAPVNGGYSDKGVGICHGPANIFAGLSSLF